MMKKASQKGSPHAIRDVGRGFAEPRHVTIRCLEVIIVLIATAASGIIRNLTARKPRNGNASKNLTVRRPHGSNGPDLNVGFRPTRRQRVTILVLILVAASAGIAHTVYLNRAEINRPKPPPQPINGSKSPRPQLCVPPVEVDEQLTIHPGAQPIFFDLKEEVSVRTDTPIARALADKSAADHLRLARCYFVGFERVPQLLIASSGGLTTFTAFASTHNEIPSSLAASGWVASVRSGNISAQFDATGLCETEFFGYEPDWTGAALTLTILSTVQPDRMSRLPDSAANHSYAWYFTPIDCKKPPSIGVITAAPLFSYLVTVGYNSVAAGIPLIEIAGWSSSIAILLLGFLISIRNRRELRRTGLVFSLLLVGLLALATGTIDLDFSARGPLREAAFLVFVYAIVAAFIASLSRRKALMISAAVLVSIIILASTFIPPPFNPTRPGSHVDAYAPYAALALEIAALMLLVTIISSAFRRPFAYIEEKWPADAVEAGPGKWLNSAILCGFTVLLVAVSYGICDVGAPFSLTNLDFAESSVLSACLVPFVVLLTTGALVVPLAAAGPAATSRIVAGAMLGFSAVAQLPDPSIAGFSIPVGEILLMILLSRVIAPEPPALNKSSLLDQLRTCSPRTGQRENNFLAVKIAGVLSIAPVGYFTFTAITSLSENLQQGGLGAVTVTAAILAQLGSWIFIGLIFSIINTRLPGNCGPLRAVAVAALWFAVAAVSYVLQKLLQVPSGQSWVFFGLELLLFLIAFGTVWDACILGELSWSSIEVLKNAYNLKQNRSIVVYAIPLLGAIIILGQQVISGNGVESVKSTLNLIPALLGG